MTVTPALAPEMGLKAPSEAEVNERVTLSAVAKDTNCSPARKGWRWSLPNGGEILGRSNRSTLDVRWDSVGNKSIEVTNRKCGDAEPAAALVVAVPSAQPPPGCVPDDDTVCLQQGRFEVEVNWAAPGFNPPSGVGHAERITGETSYFWFFNEDNIELVVKVLDGRAITGAFWVFYGALSDVEYTITVTDTLTQRKKTYFNPAKNMASFADTQAFPE